MRSWLGAHLVNEVAGASSADVVDGCLLGTQTFLLLEFFVEAEHGTLLLAAHVSGSATARGEVVGGWGSSELDAACWASCGCAVGEVALLDASYISGSAAARVNVGGLDGWVRLGDVEGRHFDGVMVDGVRVVCLWYQVDIQSLIVVNLVLQGKNSRCVRIKFCY